jgi:DNA-binding MarR family transcriptional regulator
MAPRDRQGDAAPAPKQALRLWLRLLACSSLVEKTVRSRLAADFDTTLPRFDVLAALERAPDGLQLGALSRRLRVSNGNVTGVVARLTAEGLIRRTVDPRDGRVFRVALTPAGREAFLQMAGAHEIWIETLFGGLASGEQAELLALLTQLWRNLPERNTLQTAATARDSALMEQA